MKDFTKYDPKSSDREVIDTRSKFRKFIDAIKQFNAEQRTRNEQNKMFWKFAFNANNPQAVPALLNQLAEMYPTNAKIPMQVFGQQIESCIKKDKSAFLKAANLFIHNKLVLRKTAMHKKLVDIFRRCKFSMTSFYKMSGAYSELMLRLMLSVRVQILQAA